MANIGSLVVSLSARTEQLEKGLDKARKDLRKAHGTVDSLRKQLGRMGSDAERSSAIFGRAFGRVRLSATGLNSSISLLSKGIVGLAGVAGVGFAASFIKSSIAATDALGKTADKIGVNVEALQQLRFAASQSGIEQRTLEMALQRLGRRAAEAAAGTGEAKDAFKQLGIQLRDSQGHLRPTEEILKDLARVFPRITDQNERLRLAMKLFDTEGVTMVNMLRLGADGMQAMMDKAKSLGLVLSEETVRKAEAANDQLNIMERILSMQMTRAALALAPTITRLGESVARMVEALVSGNEEMKNLSSQEADIVKTVRAIGSAFSWAASQAGDLVNYIKEIKETPIRLLSLLPFGDLLAPSSLGERPGEMDAYRERAFLDKFKNFLNPESPKTTKAPKKTNKPKGSEFLTPYAQSKKTLTALEQLNKEVDRTPHTFSDAATQITRMVMGLSDADRTMLEAQEKAAKLNETLRDEGKALTESLQTPMERYQSSLKHLNQLKGAGAISEETYGRAVQQANEQLLEQQRRLEALRTPLQEMQTAYADTFGQMQFAAVSALQSMEDAIVQFATTGKLSVKGMVDSILADLIRLSVRQTIMGPLAGALNSVVGGLAGGRQSTSQLGTGLSGLLGAAGRIQ